MDFTFGIITSGKVDSYLLKIIDSIKKENIPNYEIIIIGNTLLSEDDKIKIIPFNEDIKPMWITKKKNLITQSAKYENIVFMHDYVYLIPGWYEGYLKFGNDFKACMNIILNADGTRFRDWVLWENPDPNLIQRAEHIIPYEITNLSKYMYFSGAYWVAKKEIMEEFPLNEDLIWNKGEDIDWSKRFRNKYDFSININSAVRFLKPKPTVFNFLKDRNIIEKLKQMK